MFSYHLTFATAKVIQIFDMCKYFFHFMEIILWKNKKNKAPNALSLLHCTPYTVHSRMKNIFGIFAAIRNNSVFLQLTLCGLGY